MSNPTSRRAEAYAAILQGKSWPKQQYTKNTNPPASDSGYSVGDKVWVLNYSGHSDTPMRFAGVIVNVLETYIRVKYLRQGAYYFNRYLPTKLEKRNE
jgi:hypothetical protein